MREPSNLPPGVTDKMIEDAQYHDEDELFAGEPEAEEAMRILCPEADHDWTTAWSDDLGEDIAYCRTCGATEEEL